MKLGTVEETSSACRGDVAEYSVRFSVFWLVVNQVQTVYEYNDNNFHF
jgi:hypothetical protein